MSVEIEGARDMRLGIDTGIDAYFENTHLGIFEMVIGPVDGHYCSGGFSLTLDMALSLSKIKFVGRRCGQSLKKRPSFTSAT